MFGEITYILVKLKSKIQQYTTYLIIFRQTQQLFVSILNKEKQTDNRKSQAKQQV